MTGSLLFNRQHSSTAGYSNKKKIDREQLRRCSSADDHNSYEITTDENRSKEKFVRKVDPVLSDNDSGIEDFDQQLVNYICEKSNQVNEEEPESFFQACEDEDFEENSTLIPTQQFQSFEPENLEHLYRDLRLAAQIPHEEKKEFCWDTSAVFHGEFARLISWPISLRYPGIRYYLFVEDGVPSDPSQWPGFACVKLDNAKAQFKCPNPHCRRLWTSMRARISFKISQPSAGGFVVLKIYTQNCQFCKTPADVFWYMEEVCRIMANLSQSMFETFFTSEIPNDCLPGTQIIENYSTNYSRRSRHDPRQRKGKMHAEHDKNHCQACQHGFCFN